ncbi:MAG: hypothetical protein ICV62_13040 [Cyanobacteria bacterium Co-bin13]|nr:hypothetical protein [Cyanobacteria bacterium Co-bin13]
MKSYEPQPPSLTHRIDTWATLLCILAATVFIGSTSVLLGLETTSASGNNAALYGEAGMWSALGQKD